MLQEVENSYEATTTILAIFDCMPSDEALFDAGISPTLATELFERRQAECGISQCTYTIDEYELTRLNIL